MACPPISIEPALDVNGIAGGSPQLVKTVLPVEAEANVSIRLAPGQDVDEIREAFEKLLQTYLDRFSPRDGVERDVIEEMVAAKWRYLRVLGHAHH